MNLAPVSVYITLEAEAMPIPTKKTLKSSLVLKSSNARGLIHALIWSSNLGSLLNI